MDRHATTATPTQFQIAEAIREHEEALRECYEIEALNKAIKKQITAAIEEPYLRAVRVGTGLNNVPVLDILNHLFTNYGRLTEKELNDNNTFFSKEWNSDDAFELIITQINDCAEMADIAGNPYTSMQILNNAYTIVQNTGMIPPQLVALDTIQQQPMHSGKKSARTTTMLLKHSPILPLPQPTIVLPSRHSPTLSSSKWNKSKPRTNSSHRSRNSLRMQRKIRSLPPEPPMPKPTIAATVGRTVSTSTKITTAATASSRNPVIKSLLLAPTSWVVT
jgi:hypothetical protein